PASGRADDSSRRVAEEHLGDVLQVETDERDHGLLVHVARRLAVARVDDFDRLWPDGQVYVKGLILSLDFDRDGNAVALDTLVPLRHVVDIKHDPVLL